MQTVTLGRSSLTATRLAYGCWRLAGTWNPAEITPEREAAGRAAVLAAIEAGFTLFDHADIYAQGHCERIFGSVLRDHPGLRQRLVLVSKCGIRPPQPADQIPYRYDFSRDYIIRSCHDSLQRLGVDTLDLYLLHRPDYLMDPAEVAGAFDQLRREGRVREFGVSNFPPAKLAALQRACPMPLIVNQIEFSLAHLQPLEDGTLDQCLELGITPMAWSPLAGGQLADGARRVLPSQEAYATDAIRAELDSLAARLGTSRANLALAWLLRHPSRLTPVIGTLDPNRIREAARADTLNLPREDWYRLLHVARAQPLP